MRVPGKIKYRNMWLQMLWMILTIGMYQIYWFYETCKEMSETLERKDEIVLWTVVMCLPPLSLYSMYKQGELYETFTDKAVERWLILLLWLFFAPAVWFIIQRKLNATATGQVEPAAAQS